MEGINIERSQTLAHFFHFFISSGKACLYPFLTLFFRQIGLTAFQTGIVIGVKCFSAFIWGPLWMTCAKRCRKQRVVLMFSICVCIASGLLLTLVPTSNTEIALESCRNKSASVNLDGLIDAIKNQSQGVGNLESNGNVTTTVMPIEGSGESESNQNSVTLKPTSHLGGDSFFPATAIPVEKTSARRVSKSTNKAESSEHAVKKTTTVTTTIKATTAPTTPISTTETSSKKVKTMWESLTKETQDMLKTIGYGKKEINGMGKAEFDEFMDALEQALKETIKDEGKHNENRRHRRDILGSTLDSINQKLSEWQEKMDLIQYRSFIGVLVVILVSEVFSAPTEKLADNLWFEFLDGLDFLERYGSQRVWSTLGIILFPLIVTGIVDNTPCELVHHIHHFMIHFYLFAAVMGVTFMLAFCYPIFTEKKKVHRKSSLFKGCRILFTDIHAFCYVFTILILGMLTACIDNFLFWRVQDLGGAEIYMGGALSIAGVSQFVTYVLSKWMVRKMSSAGAIVLSLLILAARLVIYSFLWASWPILIVALLHGFSHTLLWVAVENYPDFKVNPFIMDRNAKSLLYALYSGIGYGGGSVISGYIYDEFGFSTLLQGGAILAVSWCILFGSVQKCVRHKHKVRYAKLLQAEEDQEDSDDTVYDDDWLEVALKHDK